MANRAGNLNTQLFKSSNHCLGFNLLICLLLLRCQEKDYITLKVLPPLPRLCPLPALPAEFSGEGSTQTVLWITDETPHPVCDPGHGISSSALCPPLDPLEQLTCLMATFRAAQSSGALAYVPDSPLPALHRNFLASVIILHPGLTLMPTNPYL